MCKRWIFEYSMLATIVGEFVPWLPIYHDLPLHLKACLLHCSIYPRDYWFERDSIVSKWIAEGFVHGEEAAKGCIDELVNRRLIELVRGEKKYEIHTIMLALLRCKSQEDNFVTCLGHDTDISSVHTARRIRRLSVQYQLDSVDFSRMNLSHTRSLYVFDGASAVPFKHFVRLRVLDLEELEDLENAHLVDICRLLWLRYLGLKGTPISKIPPEIGRLQHLETLDVRDTKVSELPWEAGQIPKSVCVLTRLRLPDGVSKVRELPWEAATCVSLPEGVCQDLVTRIPAPWLEKCRQVLSIVVFDRFSIGTVPPHVGVFKVRGRHMQIPSLIKEYFSVLSSLDIRLCKLGDDDLKFLREMPNLQTLVIRFEILPRVPVTISGEGFARLESFCVDSRVPRVAFDQGAMPNLKHLAFKFYASPASEDAAVGITHLRCLEKVVFRCSPWYKSDSPGISATVAAVRGEAGEHPNRITLCINGKEEIFPGKQSAQISEENRGAGSSGMRGIEAEADVLSADRNSLAGNDKKIFHNSYAIASCNRTREIFHKRSSSC